MTKLFLPQKTLEDWAVADKADIKEGRLVISPEKSTFPVTGAVHFTKLVSGTDEHKLLSKVKTKAQLDKLQAEQLADSAIVGESAYEVVEGYLTEVPDGAPDRPDESKKDGGEADLLAAFFLDKLSKKG